MEILPSIISVPYAELNGIDTIALASTRLSYVDKTFGQPLQQSQLP
jgi:hypothetical protein